MSPSNLCLNNTVQTGLATFVSSKMSPREGFLPETALASQKTFTLSLTAQLFQDKKTANKQE